MRFACGFLWGLFCSIRRRAAIVSHASVSPPAVAYTKGRHTLGAVGQESSEETSVASKMPSRNPRRGFLTENSPQDYFPIFLRLLTLPRPWGRCPQFPRHL